MNNGQRTRNEILDAAAVVILREGVGHLTLERVAREANLSKGGLLYHFNSKDCLIEALIQRLIAHFDERIARYREAEPNNPGRFTRAFVRTTVDDADVGSSEQPACGIRMFAALLAAVLANPVLLDPLRRKYAEWQTMTEADGLADDRATIVRLAADGLWFLELFDLVRFSGAQKRQLMDEMLRLGSPEEPGTLREEGK